MMADDDRDDVANPDAVNPDTVDGALDEEGSWEDEDEKDELGGEEEEEGF